MGAGGTTPEDGEERRIFPGFTPAAHRGASRQFPENTLEAFRRAQEIMPGCLLETDVHCTKDGSVVVIHDESLELKAGGSGTVAEATLEEVRSLDAGYRITFDGGATFPFRGMGCRIPLLSETLDAFPGARFSIDIKDRDPAAAERVASLIIEGGAAERVIIGSFHEKVMRYVRKKFSGIITSFSRNDIVRFLALRKLPAAALSGRHGAAMLIPEFIGGGIYESMGRGTRGFRIITPGLIRDAHRRGIPVLAWTINRPDNMERLIDWGIDGIVTDRIDLLKEVMTTKGLCR